MAEKTPLVLVPGLLNTAALWRHQIEALSGIAEIRIGDITQHERIADMAASVLKIAPDRFALAGLSLGGYVSQEIMRQAPERVTRLALLDTSARADTPDRREGREVQIALARDGRFEEVIDLYTTTMLNPEVPPDPHLQEVIRTMCRENGPDVFVRQQKAVMGRVDGRDDLAKIQCPTLVLCGRQDQPTPLEMHEEIASRIDGAKLVAIEACGHLAPLERPETVSDAMREWLTA